MINPELLEAIHFQSDIEGIVEYYCDAILIQSSAESDANFQAGLRTN
jgi:hypothetical protein